MARWPLFSLLALTWTMLVGWAEPPRDVDDHHEVYKVRQLVTNDGGSLAVVDAGKDRGLLKGATLKVYRLSTAAAGAGEGIWVQTGHLKASKVQEGVTVAEVISQGSDESSAFFPKFPGIMAGDLVVRERFEVTRKAAVTPETQIGYHELFADPSGNPSTFEMTAAGVARLKEAARAFAGSRISQLMVEGYTDQNGPANVNQAESYQRAMTIRQVLVDELGFDPQRVIALGFGEAEPIGGSMAPGHQQTNRRIVLKAVPMPRM